MKLGSSFELSLVPLIWSLFLSGILFVFNFFFPIVPDWLLTISVNLVRFSFIFPVYILLFDSYIDFKETRARRKSSKK